MQGRAELLQHPTYLQELHCFIRELGTNEPQGLLVEFALEMLLDLLFLKAAELADRTGKLDPKQRSHNYG